MAALLEDHPVVRRVGFVAVSAALFSLVAWSFGIGATESVRTQVYVATGAGVGLSVLRSPVRRLLRSGGRGTEFVVQHGNYRGLLERFVALWMLGFVALTVVSRGSVELLGVGHAVAVALVSVLALASVSYPGVGRTLRDVAWILAAVVAAGAVVFVLYLVVESLVAAELRLLSASRTVELLEPVVAAAVVVGAIQVVVGGVLGPTTRDLEHERLPATTPVSSARDEQFLRAVRELAEVWGEQEAAVRRNPDKRQVTIAVDGELAAEYSVEANPHSDSRAYSRLVSEIGDEDEKWALRDTPPRYPEGVETTRVLQVKVLTDVAELGVRDRVRLRRQAVANALGGLLP